MKKQLGILCILIFALFLTACAGTKFDGSRNGNDSQFVMEYNVFNTSDSQDMTLESGDTISAEIVVDCGKLSIIIRKDNDTPVYESTGISASNHFNVEIEESGVYTITVTGEKTKGSVSFIRVAGQKDVPEETLQEPKEEIIDLSSAFQGINGCAVIYQPAKGLYSFYNEDMCKQEATPCSTFKIISALSGLQNGVIADEMSKMNYNGTVYAHSDWNEDVTLKEAFQRSCVWYFRQVIDAVGENEIKEELNSLGYGNCDVSEWGGSNINSYKDLNGFWLESSLKISPLEQVKVLEQIFEGRSGYDSKHVETLKNIMAVPNENSSQKIYGKTGTGVHENAWFVGFSESGGERKYFAIYLKDDMKGEQVSGAKAKEIALEVLKQ